MLWYFNAGVWRDTVANRVLRHYQPSSTGVSQPRPKNGSYTQSRLNTDDRSPTGSVKRGSTRALRQQHGVRTQTHLANRGGGGPRPTALSYFLSPTTPQTSTKDTLFFARIFDFANCPHYTTAFCSRNLRVLDATAANDSRFT